MNRRRIALGAVVLFAAAVVGVALVAGHDSQTPIRSNRTAALAKLPVAPAAGAVADVAQPAVQPDYHVQGTLPALASTAPAYQVSAPTGADASRLATALGLLSPVRSVDGQFVVAD